MIDRIILWSNGNVMVFDEHGKQMPEYQGRRKEAAEKLADADLSQTSFQIGSWNNGTLPMTREQFFSESWN